MSESNRCNAFAASTQRRVFNFIWNTNPVQTTQTAVNLGAGTYTATVKGENGCPSSTNATITEPNALTDIKNIIKPSCNNADGSINLTLSGGTVPYTYTWLPNVSVANFAQNLVAGTYQITVNDANQCTHLITVPLLNNTDLTATITSIKDVSCFGLNDGIATVSATGGIAPYTYTWSPLGGNTNIANNLAADNYSATVTDKTGCKTIGTITINQPAELLTSVTLQNTSCGNNDGSAIAAAQGGTNPYQFTWSPGNITGISINNLAAGQYIVLVKDNNGCTQNDTATIAPSSAVSLQLSHTDVLCFGGLTGTATALITGGNSPYNITWTNGTQNFTGSSITGAAAGLYNVIVLDTFGCKSTNSVVIKEPSPTYFAFKIAYPVCGGVANIKSTISGGTQPYTYSWSPIVDFTDSIFNLSSGTYFLTVTDKNNCVSSASATVPNMPQLHISLGNDTAICQGDKIILSPGNFSSYTWQDNAVTPAYTVLQQGIYSVTVSDAFGCTASDTIKIIADCVDIFFPTAFTPNNDLRNDFFGPLGNLNALKDYSLVVYNRWGQLVFQSTDPFKKWDGKVQSKNPQANTFVWIAKFTYKAQTNMVRKGTVTIVY